MKRVLIIVAALVVLGSTVPAGAQMMQPMRPMMPMQPMGGQSFSAQTFPTFGGGSTTYFHGPTGSGTAMTFPSFGGGSTTYLNGPGMRSGTIQTFPSFGGGSTSYYHGF
jgi:hypothetical protein